MPRTLLLAALALAAFCPPADGARYALLVGVRQYDRAELSSLDYTENDVTVLAQVLRDGGFSRVVLLTQTRGALESRYLPTTANIRRELSGLLKDRAADDTVVLAFAGHGVQFAGSDEPYFCPKDARVSDRKTLVSLGEIYGELNRCPARVKVLFSDACRNDPLPKANRPAGEDRPFTPKFSTGKQKAPQNVVALFSCSEGEVTYESGKLKHGVFFHHLITGLRGKAAPRDGKQVTLGGLVDYVQREVGAWVTKEVGGVARQRPEMVGRYNQPIALLDITEKLVKSKPGEVKDLVQASLKLYRAGDYRKALASLDKAVGLDEGSLDALALRAHAHYYLGEHQQALADADRALRLDTNLGAPHYIRGAVALAANDTSRAIRELTEALKRSPRHRQATYDRGRAFARLRQYDRALADYNAVIRQEPAFARAYHARGLVYFNQKKWAQARDEMTAAISRDPKLAVAYADRGAAQAMLGKPAEALKDYDAALTRDPKLAMAYSLRGQLHFERKEMEKAERDLRQALRLRPGYPSARLTLARLQLSQGKTKEALAGLDALLKESPRDAEGHNLRGVVNMKLGKAEEAVGDFTRAIEFEPKNAAFYTNRARAHAARGMKEEADADRATAKKLGGKGP